MDDRAEHRSRIRDAIVAHLQAHADASDTAEGIRGWWLGPRGCEEDVTVVEEALDELVMSGLVRRRPLPDGGVIYTNAAAGGR
jgi:hypothetical protein